METSGTRPGRWISYRSGPGGRDHLLPDVRAQAEQQEKLRAEGRGRLLCEVHVQVYEHGTEAYVGFTDGAALGAESDAGVIAAAVRRARDCLTDWR
ncbi:MAG: hypothetical protein M3Y33_11480 [Actinomycetota bacterium]|nr:hypothetical protein [Actinomycetota bacterium]